MNILATILLNATIRVPLDLTIYKIIETKSLNCVEECPRKLQN